jgi:hypothetical protein
MLCPRCHGTHVILVNGQRLPCPECQGVGQIHCCDGLTEQPDACEIPPQPPPAEPPEETRSPSGRG